MNDQSSFVTLEQALARGQNEAFKAFSRYVNPIEAKLLRFGNFDKLYNRAQGLYLFDDVGRRYMDFTAGYGALNLGHNPAEVSSAIEAVKSLPNVMLMGFRPLAGALAETLAHILPGELSAICFGNGGAEAVEIALKMARAATGKTGLVSCDKGYHGLSFGAMSVSGCAKYRDIFGPLLEDCETVPFGNIDAARERIVGNDVAAFIVEPLLGEGGAVAPPAGYLKDVWEICRAHNTLLIFDEIQTGFGRTGRLFASEHDDVVPDMMLLSKSLAAGVVPISVCAATRAIWDCAFGTREKFDLATSTFGGNATACAASLKAIEITLRDNLAARAAELGEYALARLKNLASKHEAVKTIHGKGLLLGIELQPPFSETIKSENFALVIASCLLNDHGVLTTYFDLAPTFFDLNLP